MRDLTECLLEAIDIRNKIANGLMDKPEQKVAMLKLASSGVWNVSHIAELVGWSSQAVGRIVPSAVRPAQRPGGGRLDREALDLLLELRGAVLRGQEPSPALVQECIKTRTGTRLISRLTGIPLGVILYQQRKMKGD